MIEIQDSQCLWSLQVLLLRTMLQIQTKSNNKRHNLSLLKETVIQLFIFYCLQQNHNNQGSHTLIYIASVLGMLPQSTHPARQRANLLWHVATATSERKATLILGSMVWPVRRVKWLAKNISHLNRAITDISTMKIEQSTF